MDKVIEFPVSLAYKMAEFTSRDEMREAMQFISISHNGKNKATIQATDAVKLLQVEVKTEDFKAEPFDLYMHWAELYGKKKKKSGGFSKGKKILPPRTLQWMKAIVKEDGSIITEVSFHNGEVPSILNEDQFKKGRYGIYPDVEGVFQSLEHKDVVGKWELDRDLLTKYCDALNSVDENSNALFRFSKLGKVIIETKSPQNGIEATASPVPGDMSDYTGQDLTIGFNLKLVQHTLKNLPLKEHQPTLTIRFFGENVAAVVTFQDNRTQNGKALIMPVMKGYFESRGWGK